MSGSAPLIRALTTPFDAVKTAGQNIDFAIDPSFGFTRRRYGWYSNNTLFDSTLTSTVPGGLSLQTTATGTDAVRLRSALPGQYISQTVAVPGQGVHIDSANVDITDRLASISHGTVAIGAGWHDGSEPGWGVNPGPIQTFLGFVFQLDGAYAVLVSDGEHKAGSPVPQSEWNVDPMDGTGDTGNVMDPAAGYIWNEPYTWYNEGPLFVSYVDKSDNSFWPAHQFEVEGEPSLDTPNLPCMVIVDNDGTASGLGVTVGGMQYSRYGSGLNDVEIRQNNTSRITSGNYIDQQVTINNEAIDPNGNTGVPLIAIRRESAHRDVQVVVDDISGDASSDVYLYTWDDWDYTSANFRTPHPPQVPQESKIEVDTDLTTYTPGTAAFRGYRKLLGANNNAKVGVQSADTDDRLPIDAVRIITAVHDGSAGDIELSLRIAEGF